MDFSIRRRAKMLSESFYFRGTMVLITSKCLKIIELIEYRVMIIPIQSPKSARRNTLDQDRTKIVLIMYPI
jgi:hypothetical protein